MFKKVKQAVTLLELIIVITILGILMSLYYYMTNNSEDIAAVETDFVNTFLKEIVNNPVKYNNQRYLDIPYKYCPGGDPENCKWDDDNKCIIGKYQFDKIPGLSAPVKRLINGIIEYKLCPKFLPDGSINDTTATGKKVSNPSFYIKYKYKGQIRTIIYPLF